MVKYIDFEIYRAHPELTAAFSTKEGGVSSGIFESMNLSLSSADDPENVKENYRRFAESLDLTPGQFVISNQQHTTNLRIVSGKDRGKGLLFKRDYDAVDGFVTDETGLALCLLFADCVPVYLYDPVKKVISLVHSGWKGTVGKISEKAIALMSEQYGSRPEDLLVAIGPSICQDCYEVSGDLLQQFEEAFGTTRAHRFFEKGQVTEEGEQKYQLSLWKAIEATLLAAGVRKEQIDNPQLCTCCNHERFFSHRYTKGRRGNLAAVMALRENSGNQILI